MAEAFCIDLDGRRSSSLSSEEAVDHVEDTHHNNITLLTTIQRPPQKFNSLYFTMRATTTTTISHHTLIAFSAHASSPSVSIHGPCCIIGAVGGKKKETVSVSGYALRRASGSRGPLTTRSPSCVVLWSVEEKAVLQPLRQLSLIGSGGASELHWKRRIRQAAEREEAASPKSASVVKREYGDGAEEEAGPSSTAGPLTRLIKGPGRGGLLFPNISAEAGDEDEEDEEDEVEDHFGSINWEWVAEVLENWKRFFGGLSHMPSVALVLHPVDPANQTGANKYFLRRNERKGKKETVGDAYMEVPAFISRRRAAGVDDEHLPKVYNDLFGPLPPPPRGSAAAAAEAQRRAEVKADARKTKKSPATEKEEDVHVTDYKLRSVAVVGSTGSGKSTHCRHLTNAFLASQRLQMGGAAGAPGVLWLDVDLGQPEFGLPGELGLYRVHAPLFQPHDASAVEAIATYFLGTITVACPVSSSEAVASLCGLTLAILRAVPQMPLVINTHGWVLHTGRRMTCEVLRRLHPRHVIHLLREGEPCWSLSTRAVKGHPAGELWRTQALPSSHLYTSVYPVPEPCVQPASCSKLEEAPWMSPETGLNGSLLSKRFLLRSYNKRTRSTQLLSRLSPPTGTLSGGCPPSSQRPLCSTGIQTWVHILPVRWAPPADAVPRGKLESRRQRWINYFMPLISFYEQEEAEATAAATTTLLEAPLSCVSMLTIAGGDEKVTDAGDNDSPLPRCVPAYLEHAVVAVQLGPTTPPPFPSTITPTVCSLSSLGDVFPFTCFGYVESVEEELAAVAPTLRLRVPLSPKEVSRLLSSGGGAGGEGGVALGYSAVLRSETAFMEEYC